MQNCDSECDAVNCHDEVMAMHCDNNLQSGLNEVPLEGKFPMFIDPLRDNCNNPPCYMPQEHHSHTLNKAHLNHLGPIDHWAGFTANWSPRAGATGVRPVVNRYSITRFSPNEWAEKNAETLNKKENSVQRTTNNAKQSKTKLIHITEHMTELQNDTTELLRDRAQAIGHIKDKLNVAITALIEEICSMEEARLRLKKALQILCMPISIATECIELRSKRPGTELVRDATEEALVKELALTAEIRRTLKQLMEDIEKQQSDNRKMRQRLEFDWSDKEQSYHMDTTNFQTRNNSRNIVFRPGAVRTPTEQSSEECWLEFTRVALNNAECCRQCSIKLRETLNTTLLKTARDLRSQADTVEKSLDLRIKCLQQNIQRFENELKDCLQKLSETENRICSLQQAIANFDPSTKVVQTRLHVRSYRPNYENCRDLAQGRLLAEHCYIQNGLSAIIAEHAEAEKCKNDLMLARGQLERELLLKRHALRIDNDCFLRKRALYPSAIALSGFVEF